MKQIVSNPKPEEYSAARKPETSAGTTGEDGA